MQVARVVRVGLTAALATMVSVISVVTTPAQAQTRPGAGPDTTRIDSVALFRRAMRAHALQMATAAEARLDTGLLVARARRIPVLVYVVGSTGKTMDVVFDTFVHSREFGPLMHDNFVLVPIPQAEYADMTLIRDDSTRAAVPILQALAPGPMRILHADGTPLPDSIGVLTYPYNDMSLWGFAMRLTRAAPHLSEADRIRIFTYLGQWL